MSMKIKDCVSQHKIGRNSSLNPVFRKQLASLSMCEIKLTNHSHAWIAAQGYKIQPLDIFSFFVTGCLVRYTPPDFFTCLVYAKGTNVFCQKVTFFCQYCAHAVVKPIPPTSIVCHNSCFQVDNGYQEGTTKVQVVSYHYAYYALHIIFTQYPSE